MNFNPAILYFGAALFFLLPGKRKRKFFAILIPLLALFSILFLNSEASLTVNFLNLELRLLEVNRIGRIIAGIFVIYGLMAVIFTFDLLKQRLYILAYLFIGSSVGLMFVGDFFSFLILWELMTILSFFIILVSGGKSLKRIAYYYFIMHMVGGICLLWGIVLQYNGTGSIILTVPEFGKIFFVLAVGIKLAFIGLHTWLPQTYSRVPFSVSILLTAYTTKAGVYAFYRLLEGPVLEYAGIILALGAVFLALKQTKIRKILSYHLISQTGFMLTGIAVNTKLGIDSGIFHLTNHVLYKGLLFMSVGVIIYTTGKECLTSLGNLYRKLPVTTAAALVGSLAISGFPFFNGYLSKLLIKKAAGDKTLISIGLFLASLGTALSFMKFVYYSFFNKNSIEIENKPTFTMKLAMVLVILVIIIIGVFPGVYEVLFNVQTSINYFQLQSILGALFPILLAGVIFIVASDIIEPRPQKAANGKSFYLSLGKCYNVFSQQLSSFHNGNPVRYIIWLLTFLVFIWGYFFLKYGGI